MILYIFILSAITNTVANILNIVNFNFMFHADMNSIYYQPQFLHVFHLFLKALVSVLSLRCLHLRRVHHHHLCQCWTGSDRKPDASLPVSVPTKLHSTGLPFQPTVHHWAQSLLGKPPHSSICTEILSLQRCGPQCLFCSVYSGEDNEPTTIFNDVTESEITSLCMTNKIVQIYRSGVLSNLTNFSDC